MSLHRLSEVYQTYLEREKKNFRFIQDEESRPRAMGSFWHYWEWIALHAFFLEANLSRAKQCFYTCGRIDEYMIQHYDAKVLHYGIDHVTYAVLSDCEPLIRRYSRLRDSRHEAVKQRSGVACLAMQHLMAGDWEGLEEDILIFRKLAQKRGKEGFFAGLHLRYHEAMLERNLEKVEAVLREFETPGNLKKRSLGTLLNEFISHPTLGYAKLAWRHGLEVEVDSPLVPRELLPVRPLERYEDVYDFLEELDA